MDRAFVEDEIKKIFLNIFVEINESKFDWNTPHTEYENWDSFVHLRLVSQIEKKFNFQFNFDDSINLNSASDFLKLTLKILDT